MPVGKKKTNHRPLVILGLVGVLFVVVLLVLTNVQKSLPASPAIGYLYACIQNCNDLYRACSGVQPSDAPPAEDDVDIQCRRYRHDCIDDCYYDLGLFRFATTSPTPSSTPG
jgi:hypothetical protein